MKRGELFILPPGLPYCVQNTPEDLVITIISPSNLFQKNFHTLIYQNNPLSAFFRKSLFELRSDPVYFQLPASPEIRSLIQHLFAEFVKRDALSKIAFNDYLQILYIHIIRSLEQMVLTIADTRRLTVMEMMPSILQYIQKNYHTVTLDSLAELFHYESSYMSKQIRLATGRTFSDIVTNFRLTEARDLLLNTRESIEHIAELVGYNSGDHFSYMFRKVYVISPMRYRQMQQEGISREVLAHIPEFFLVKIGQGRQKVNLSANAEGLRLWTLDKPELYRAIVTVEAGANKDQKKVTFGVRTIAFTREQGFLLNGKPVKLKGGCIHHDNGIVGSCAFSAMEERKIRLLKESGYNAIRTSHNPMSTALLDAVINMACL